MPRPNRAIKVAIIAAVVLAFLGGGTHLYLRARASAADGRLKVPGLQAPVEVIRDSWGVPHIYARNEEDLFFTQGFVQAQDRFWQMEVYRRAAHGTLAEMLGEDALGSDKVSRTLGFAQAAHTRWEALDADTRRMLEAYARGVNAYLLAPDTPPFEFALLEHVPEPWHPIDTLAWAQLLAWSQSTSWEAEIVRARLVRAVGPERAGHLDPAIAKALEAGGALSELAALAHPLLLEEMGQEWPWASAVGHAGVGWVTDGSRSASGGPILAAAPQMPVQMPSPWYLMHLVGGRYDVVGATFPGIPGVAVGRNRTIAWAMVGSTVDNVDLYIERVRPGDPPQAEHRGQWQDMQVREEEIRVREQDEPVRIRVLTTRHGPLVTSLDSGSSEQLALRWVGSERPATLLPCLLALNRASNWEELMAALRDWTVPAWMVLFADVQGNVGHATAAAVPRRVGGDGGLPLPGWTGEHRWRGLLTSEALPHGPQPTAGTLMVIDGAVLSESWPDRRWEGAAPSHTARRIADLIAAHSPLTVEDAQLIQCDDRGPEQQLLSLLLALPAEDWIQERSVPYLEEWDWHYDAESAGAGIYEVFYWHFAHNMLGDELGADLVDAYLNTNPNHRAVLGALATQPDHPWFDGVRALEREDCNDILIQSFADGLTWLGRNFGDLPYEWNWGRVHRVTFGHTLGQRWPLTVLLNRGALRTRGGPWCVDATSPDYRQGMLVRGAASHRLIIDLGPGGEAATVNAPGQCGDPFSRHYADMVDSWRDGDYHPLLFERAAIVPAERGTLTLVPGR